MMRRRREWRRGGGCAKVRRDVWCGRFKRGRAGGCRDEWARWVVWLSLEVNLFLVFGLLFSGDDFVVRVLWCGRVRRGG